MILESVALLSIDMGIDHGHGHLETLEKTDVARSVIQYVSMFRAEARLIL